MMDWSDHHCRYFWRLLTRQALLYTEMIVADAVVKGDRERLLRFDPSEHPVALQIGGSDPEMLAQAAKIDGAKRWNLFRYVELPKIKRVLMIAILLRFLDSFMVYAEPFILTRGGPGKSTVFLSQSLMLTASKQFDLGHSAAVSLIYLSIIVLFSWILYKVM